jgi:predicted MFS family arabinose efflux permease
MSKTMTRISIRKLFHMFALVIMPIVSFVGLSIKADAQEAFTIQGGYARIATNLGNNAGTGIGICLVDAEGKFNKLGMHFTQPKNP